MSKEYEAIGKLDPRSLKILAELVASQVRWDLIKFFKRNPYSIHTAQGLARMIGRQFSKVEAETEALVDAKVLRRISQEDGLPSIYAYDPAGDVRDAIDLADIACDLSGDHIDGLRSFLESFENPSR